MLKKLLFIFSMIGILYIPLLSANEKSESIQQRDINEINDYVEEDIDEDIYENIEDEIDAYISQKKKESKKNTNSKKIFISSLMPVALKPTNPDFVKSLSLAYDKAFFDAQQQFVMDVFGRIISQKEKTLFANNSTDRKKFESDKISNQGIGAKLGRLFDKTLSLAEKSLDNALIKLGVNPSEIESATKKEKQTLMKDALISVTMEQASGKVSGFVPIKTFVGKDKDGQYYVGVVGMRSDKTSAVARAIASKREPKIYGNGKAIEDLIPKEKNRLLSEMGVRLVFDDSGRPALISFAQWGFNANGLSSYMRTQAKNNAKKMAESIADAMVSDFVNGSMVVSSDKERGEIIEQTIQREDGRDGMAVEETITKIVDKINEAAKLKSKMDKAGFSTVKRWSIKNEHGLYVVGVIRKWTFEGLESAQSTIHNRAIRKRRNKYSTDNTNYESSIDESSEYNTVNDF